MLMMMFMIIQEFVSNMIIQQLEFVSKGFGRTEVADLDVALRVEEDVLRLEVAVDVVLAVQRLQRQDDTLQQHGGCQRMQARDTATDAQVQKSFLSKMHSCACDAQDTTLQRVSVGGVGKGREVRTAQ